LKELLNSNKNYCIQTFLQGLTPTESNDYSLQKVDKKAHPFAEHLAEVFQLHCSENESKEEEALIQLLKAPLPTRTTKLTASKELKFKESSAD
jgi:hypothetical protein